MAFFKKTREAPVTDGNGMIVVSPAREEDHEEAYRRILKEGVTYTDMKTGHLYGRRNDQVVDLKADRVPRLEEFMAADLVRSDVVFMRFADAVARIDRDHGMCSEDDEGTVYYLVNGIIKSDSLNGGERGVNATFPSDAPAKRWRIVP